MPRLPRLPASAHRGFTLIELLLVIAIVAIATGLATLSLRDGNATRLDEEGERLSALLEGGRAKSRAMGLAVRWVPGGDSSMARPNSDGSRTDFRFVGLPASVVMPHQFLDERVRAEVIGAPELRLGPEPVIGAQRVLLRLEDRRIVLATDGLGPFVRVDEAAAP